VLWYAWNPACAVEFCWSGHLDCLVVTALLGAWRLLQAAGRTIPAGACLAAGTLLKFYPALGIPALLAAHASRWRQRVTVAALFGLLVLAAYLPYASAGQGLFRSAADFRARWRFNDSGYALALHLFSWTSDYETPLREFRLAGRDGYDLLFLRRDQPLPAEAARRAIEVGMIVLVLVLAARRVPYERVMLATMGYILILSPTVHPWYVLPILVFAAARGSWAWLYLSLAAQFTYLPMIRGGEAMPSDAVPIRVVEYLPFYALLVVQSRPWAALIRRLRGRGATACAGRGDGGPQGPQHLL
jgi:hypothetical protein